jgi:hypothetical protein
MLWLMRGLGPSICVKGVDRLNWLKEEDDSWMPWVTEEARPGIQAALTAGVDAKGWPGQ